jgi:hypothetical protein
VDTVTPLHEQERGWRKQQRRTRGGSALMIVGLGLAGTGAVLTIVGGVWLVRGRAQR